MASKLRKDADCQEKDSAISDMHMFDEPPTLSENGRADEPALEPEPHPPTQETDQHPVNYSQAATFVPAQTEKTQDDTRLDYPPVQETSNSGASFMHGEPTLPSFNPMDPDLYPTANELLGEMVEYFSGCHTEMHKQGSELAQRRRQQATQNVAATAANEPGKRNTKIEELEFQLQQEVENNRILRETISAREEEKKILEQQKNAEIKILKNTIQTMKNEKAATEKDTEERNRKYEEEIKKLQAQIRGIDYKHTKEVCLLSQEISRLKHELKDQTIQLITRDKELAQSRQKTAELTADLETIAREKAEAEVKQLRMILAQQQTQQQPTQPDPTASSDDAVSNATNNSGEGCFEILSTHTRSTAYSSAYTVSTDDDDSQ